MRPALYVLPAVGAASILVGAFITQGGSATYVRIEAAPRGRNGALTFQIDVGTIDGNFRTTRPGLPLVVHAVMAKEPMRTEVVTNDEGTTEATFQFFGSTPGKPLELIVADGQEGKELIRATGDVFERPEEPPGVVRFVQPTRREGSVLLDVVLEGGTLAPSIERKGWVRMSRAGALATGATLTVEADEADVSRVADLCAPGWGRFDVTSHGLAPGLRLRADFQGGEFGTWEGAVPQLPGAGGIVGLASVPPDASQRVGIVSASARDFFYVEILDRSGRAFATSVKLGPKPGGLLESRLELPPLARGPHWLVLSGDTSPDAEASVSPFLVAATKPSCAEEAEANAVPVPSRARRLFADSSESVMKAGARRRLTGRLIALFGLLFTGALEFLLVRRELARDDATKRSLVPLVLVMLGFALLALLVMGR